MSSQESRQRFSQTCAFLPGSCLPADDGGNLGSLCLQLRSLSIVAGSQTSSPWRRMSQGQNFCTPVPEKRHLRTHAVYTVSSMHQRRIFWDWGLLVWHVENVLFSYLVISTWLQLTSGGWLFWINGLEAEVAGLLWHIIKQLLNPPGPSVCLYWVTAKSTFYKLQWPI